MYTTFRTYLGLGIITALLFYSGSSIGQASLPVTSGTKIVMLGTGTPNADPDRAGPSLAVVVNDTPYLVDFGPGVVRRASAAYSRGIEGLQVRNLKTAFVTHLHSDHTVGYADLILTPWVLGRDAPLHVYGPKGIGKMTRHILAAYQEDIKLRIEGLEQANRTGHQVITHDIQVGRVYTDANVSVDAFPVDHGSWSHAFGFKFTTPDRTIVISGDCRPSPSIIKNCSGCDVLIHEVYSAAELEAWQDRNPSWAKYMRSFHTSTVELAQLASQAKPKLLILYHQVTNISDEQLLEEIRARYSGQIVSGKDLDVY